ncbi:MAG: TfoX/Sxy family protein [Clostridia bacterium]|nr:TfoX/Sxy family protein [Clostridia bacterium]
MASGKDFLAYVLEQLSALDGVSSRPMMGEYVIYYRSKVVGGIYDDRFLVKPTKSAREMLPDASFEQPYDGAKEMLAPDVDDRELLCRLIPAIADDLPAPKQKK